MKRIAFLTAIISLSLPSVQARTLCSSISAGQPPHMTALAKKAGKGVKAPDHKAAAPAKEAAKDAGKDAEKPAADAATEPAEAKQEEPAAQPHKSSKANEVCQKLRSRMEAAEKELAAISKPSRTIVSRCKSTKTYVENQLERMETTAAEIDELQDKLNNNKSKDFQFTVTQDQRFKYVQDGTTAYKAMVADMKEDKKSRKIKGLEKFEVMRESFQGMPEYKEADQYYERTLRDLERSWNKMKAAEEKKREKLQSAKRQRLEEDDNKGFEKLEKQLQADGDDIAKVWYKPDPRNMRMLENCLNKVRDALRRRESSMDRQSEYIGCVPDLLNKFWDGMEKARTALVSGNTDAATEHLEEIDDVFNTIIRLPRNVMQDSYKEPLRKQRESMVRAIRDRESETARLVRALESKTSSLERDRENVQARIDSLMDDIADEQSRDVGESTIDSSTPTAGQEDGKPDAEDKGGQKTDKAKGDKPKTGKGKDKKAKDKKGK